MNIEEDEASSPTFKAKPVRVDIKILKLPPGLRDPDNSNPPSSTQMDKTGNSVSSTGKKKQQPSIKSMFQRVDGKKRSSDADSEKSSSKKIALDNDVKLEADVKSEVRSGQISNRRCRVCRQLLESPDTVKYPGHSDDAVDEFTALFDPKVAAIQDMDMEDSLEFKLTLFTVYDKEGHVVPFDNDVMESGGELYFSGYVKSLFNENSSAEDGIAVKDVGPLNAWWTWGFDGGEKTFITLSTETADYHLMEASEIYQPFFRPVMEKAFISKKTIEFLDEEWHRRGDGSGSMDDLEDDEDSTEFEDFLNYLATVKPLPGMKYIDQEMIMRHAEFLCNQVYSYNEGSAVNDEEKVDFTKLPVMQRIMKMSGIIRSQMKRLRLRKGSEKLTRKPAKKMGPTLCTVTPLVRQAFLEVFSEQMVEDEKNEESKIAGTKKSSAGDIKQENSSVSGDDGEEEDKENDKKNANRKKSFANGTASIFEKKKDNSVSWTGDGTKVGKSTYYSGVTFGDDELVLGDCVVVQGEREDDRPLIVKLVHLYSNSKGSYGHGNVFYHGADTVLGSTGDPTQLFITDECLDFQLSKVDRKTSVEMRPEPDQEAWRAEGGKDRPRPSESDVDKYWAQLWYDPKGRFEYPTSDPPCPEGKEAVRYCGRCEKRQREEERYDAKPVERDETTDAVTAVEWNYTQIKVGDCVYLSPGTVKLKFKKKKIEPEVNTCKDYDEDKYPEKYRKTDHVKGNNYKTPSPFQVAMVTGFSGDAKEMSLKVQMFYRPEDTNVKNNGLDQDMNQLYWSEEKATVPSSSLQGKCFVRRLTEDDLDEDSLARWTEVGPDRWYYRESFDAGERAFGKPGNPQEEKFLNSYKDCEKVAYPEVPHKLRCLDVFAGCGGLSNGLHEAGIAESRWAIEVFEPAAEAYKLNNPSCTVFTEDCNLLLKWAMEGVEFNSAGQKIPKRGDVELLCGGPPCQGFSGMNRFNKLEYSKFKNSLVSTYISYCEYYRPRYFILENVKNFACYKKNMVLKMCLRALVTMGYQCTFGILQAGQFGVAQTRRRAILLAAAPGEVLPQYPEPLHVFSPLACHLSVEIDDVRYEPQISWVDSAPYRTVTVRDTMSDLPRIKNGENRSEMKYGNKPKSHFQRNIRKGSQILLDHVTKDMAPLIEKRFELIPTEPGSDWRDLPNEVMLLSDGTYTKKLLYFYRDAKQGRGKNGAERGVCPCADGKSKCDPKDKQQNTLIPWCLPHTSNRHNHWAGLYGRVEWDGFFSTTVTNPEPMGKQGRVLHPEQHRLVSVRECARSQGFPDIYQFYGSTLEKHRQIGNAVPPPMGKVLGLEIRKAVAKAETKAQVNGQRPKLEAS